MTVAVVAWLGPARFRPLVRQVLIHLGIEDPLRQRLLQLIEQPILSEHILWILSRQQFLDQLVSDRYTSLHPSRVTV